ncbi:PIH1 domain-containing protein 1, partial [Nowakowskiella sp. JEL0078]
MLKGNLLLSEDRNPMKDNNNADLEGELSAEELQALKEFASATGATSIDELISATSTISEVAATALAASASHTTEISPNPGFVIKTHTLAKSEEASVEKDMKVFINMVYSENVPAPPLASDEEIRKALEAQDAGAYKVPLSLAEKRIDTDKAGNKCLVFDACINDQPMKKAEKDFDYK